MHRNVAGVHEAWPGVNLLMTEGCIEKFDPARLQDWANGERYGSQMIADLNAGSSGWVDWNMLLDARGGPNHKNNFCLAPLHASDDGQPVFTPIYTAIGHFSRYIRPRARRVGVATSRSATACSSTGARWRWRFRAGRCRPLLVDRPVAHNRHKCAPQVRAGNPARPAQTPHFSYIVLR